MSIMPTWPLYINADQAAEKGEKAVDNERISSCDDCDRKSYWECVFCCTKCYEDYGECPNPDCAPYGDI